jgi:hypothetical protein
MTACAGLSHLRQTLGVAQALDPRLQFAGLSPSSYLPQAVSREGEPLYQGEECARG